MDVVSYCSFDEGVKAYAQTGQVGWCRRWGYAKISDLFESDTIGIT
jgi:hypothetical protein